MFYPASVLLRRFSVYASSHKLLRKELIAFIDFLCHFPAYIGQVEKSILVHCQKAAIPQNAHRMTDTLSLIHIYGAACVL